MCMCFVGCGGVSHPVTVAPHVACGCAEVTIAIACCGAVAAVLQQACVGQAYVAGGWNKVKLSVGWQFALR
jgi:hypothetical protein